MNWLEVLSDCGVSPQLSAAWCKAFESEATPKAFSAFDEELDDFLSQVLHESGMLSRTVENLNYKTADRIQAVWPSRFPNSESAAPFVRNPEALANKVYGGRLGNHKDGDGWKYRGRGLIMVTGRDNYRRLGHAIGVDLENNPEFLEAPTVALKASIAWWERNVPDVFVNDVVKVTKAVNGGKVGLDHRTELYAKAKAAIKRQKGI